MAPPAVDLGLLAAALSGGGSLPAKRVVITLDDGFANQTVAFDILKAHYEKCHILYHQWRGGQQMVYWRWPALPMIHCNRHRAVVGRCYLTWDQVGA